MVDVPAQTYNPEGKPADALTLTEAVNRLWSNSGGLAVNIGSGDCPKSGWVNVDIRPDAENVDVVCDLFNDEWPFESNSVGLLYSSHFMEHVPADKWWHVWNESWRVMKDGGHTVTLAPYATSSRFHQDPTHIQPIIPDKWAYLSLEWRRAQKVHHGGMVDDMNFVLDVDPWFIWNEDFKHATVERQRYALRHYNNVVDDIVIFACAAKSAETVGAIIDRFGTTL